MDRRRILWAACALVVAAMSVALAQTVANKPKARVTAEQAKQIALKKYPHAHADRQIPLEHEEGKWQYAVTLHVKTQKGTVMHEVMVGATSGKIEADEVTSAREEAKEKAAEARASHNKGHQGR